MTLGRAPSIPAATIRTSQSRSFVSLAKRRWIPATPTSNTLCTSIPRLSKISAASSHAVISVVPAETIPTRPPETCGNGLPMRNECASSKNNPCGKAFFSFGKNSFGQRVPSTSFCFPYSTFAIAMIRSTDLFSQ